MKFERFTLFWHPKLIKYSYLQQKILKHNKNYIKVQTCRRNKLFNTMRVNGGESFSQLLLFSQ